MIKKDWTVFRITILLYSIIILLPINYYFAKQSFQSVQNDATTMNSLVIISKALHNLTDVDDLSEKNILIKEIDNSLKTIEQSFIHYSQNKEYVALFRANEVYIPLKEAYQKLKKVLNDSNLIKVHSYKTFKEVGSFSKVTKEMMSYKMKTIQDRLYLSLAFTMILIVSLVLFIRVYIKLQLKKHAIHDHTTGLYNKKYFDNVLHNIELLETRQEKPLSLLILSITNYKELQNSLGKKSFEQCLVEFSTTFSHFFRRSDTLCRIEDDYFTSITPDVTLVNIKKLSEKLEQELYKKSLNNKFEINFCIGVATYNKDSSTALLEEAKIDLKNSDKFTIGNIS